MRNYFILFIVSLIVFSCSKSDFFADEHGHDAHFLEYELRGGAFPGMTCDTSCLIAGVLDSDCDGVIDSLDLCHGGVDSIDNNMDGLPDCAFPPAFEDIIGDWKCGQGDSTKVIICHVPPGNPANAHHICVSPNAIKAHVNQNNNHADYLGPCKEICLDSTIVTNPPTTGNLDADCDGVTDSLDVCAGGDDTIDNNNDGLPDCAYPPAFSDIVNDWKCGTGDSTKVIICHVPSGNPGNAKDKCVSPNAINSHMAHGDYLGPCNDAFCP